MTNLLMMVLLLAALICFLLDAAGVQARIQLRPLGLAFWVLAILIGLAPR